MFSVSPEPFVGQVNRATAESSQARAIAEGLGPLQRFVSGLMNRIIACELGSPDLEFVWQDTREQDPAEATQIDVAYVGAGIMTADEVRERLGLAALTKAPAAAKPVEKFNPNHVPAGNPDGGQFTTAARAGESAARISDSLGMDVSDLPGIGAAYDSNNKEDNETEVAGDNSWGNPSSLQRHFEEHGADFDSASPEEYAKQAKDFLKSANNEGIQSRVEPEGYTRVYDPKTNTFGYYNPDGSTRTFFKPDEGQTYFDNQQGELSIGSRTVETEGGSVGAGIKPENLLHDGSVIDDVEHKLPND